MGLVLGFLFMTVPSILLVTTRYVKYTSITLATKPSCPELLRAEPRLGEVSRTRLPTYVRQCGEGAYFYTRTWSS